MLLGLSSPLFMRENGINSKQKIKITCYQYVASQFSKGSMLLTSRTNLGKNKYQVSKEAEISCIPPPLVPSRPSKSDLAKFKYHQNRNTKSTEKKRHHQQQVIICTSVFS